MAERSFPYTALVGQVIRAEMAERGWTPQTFAKALGVESDTTLRRWLDGRTRLTFDRLVQIEHLLDLRPRGALLRLAGLVEDARTLREAIAGDLTIESDLRRSLLLVYDAYATQSAADSGGRSASSPSKAPDARPKARRTRRS